MWCELVCSKGLIRQANQVGSELVAKSKQAAGPSRQEGGCEGVARSPDSPSKDSTTDSGSHEPVAIPVDDQASGLCHEVARRRVEFSSFEQRLKSVLVEGQPHKLTKRSGRELDQMGSVAQRIFYTPQLASADNFDTMKPECRFKRLNVISHRNRISLKVVEQLSDATRV